MIRYLPVLTFWFLSAAAADEIVQVSDSTADIGIAGAAIGLAAGVVYLAIRVIDAKTDLLSKSTGPPGTTEAIAKLTAAVDTLTKTVNMMADDSNKVAVHERMLVRPDIGKTTLSEDIRFLNGRIDQIEINHQVIEAVNKTMTEVRDVLTRIEQVDSIRISGST